MTSLNPQALRRRLLHLHNTAGVGHLGGNLGCIDILAAVFGHAMAADDQFVFSKGHAAGALYVTLWTYGYVTDANLATTHFSPK
jgi:transketolase